MHIRPDLSEDSIEAKISHVRNEIEGVLEEYSRKNNKKWGVNLSKQQQLNFLIMEGM